MCSDVYTSMKIKAIYIYQNTNHILGDNERFQKKMMHLKNIMQIVLHI